MSSFILINNKYESIVFCGRYIDEKAKIELGTILLWTSQNEIIG